MENPIFRNARACAVIAMAAMLTAAHPAHAQRAEENAVTSADDAFGTNLGNETTGIYNENDTRGFSPLKAGNYRIDGIYFDPVAGLAGRLRESTSIRVGYAANDYPFPAPTGIADTHLRTAGNDLGASVGFTRSQFGGWIAETDLRIPLIDDHLSLAAGYGGSYSRTTDGAIMHTHGGVFKPVLRWGGAEISPFLAMGQIYDNTPRPLIVTTGAFLPPMPKPEKYLGQTWAKGLSNNSNFGITAKVPLAGNLSFRGGLFLSEIIRKHNYTEIFRITDPSGLSDHLFTSDPRQNIHSWSGEAQVAWRFGSAAAQHRLIAGYRQRDRHTESGGSDTRYFGQVTLGQLDPEPMPGFAYTPVNVGRVRQHSYMLGYAGSFAGLGKINLGVQRASYRADFLDSGFGATTIAGEEAWLYNASFAFDVTPQLSFFAGTQRGLEDSGAAPENAANRNEQLPATRSTQYEGGLRWNFGPGGTKSHLVLSAFHIAKPYFSFDGANSFVNLGEVRHRGIELSLAGHFGKRLNLLAGTAIMDPSVSGPGRTAGLVGERPAGTPSVFTRIDANYRTDIFTGLTPTIAIVYTGRRAAGSRPQAALGGKQLMLPAQLTFDLGLRQQFRIGKIPASFRAVLQNAFDHAGWKVIAGNTLLADERRRLTIFVTADF